ncbi:MAG: RES family NAD+ phosphorylase [Rhodospirillales bacterium]|nr:RES family NAD+ phosphorylase [Rhodospirillales bacterium]
MLASVDMPLVAEEIVEYAFKGRQNRTKPFKEGRFGDGTMGVYYSAIDEVTCEKEIAFHVGEEVNELPREQFPHLRHYSLINCQYSGRTADLRGKESQYLELTSESKSGYPFCQSLGLRAVENGIDGFFTPSARHAGGTCVPVFERTALSKPRITNAVTLKVTSKGLEFKRK